MSSSLEAVLRNSQSTIKQIAVAVNKSESRVRELIAAMDGVMKSDKKPFTYWLPDDPGETLNGEDEDLEDQDGPPLPDEDDEESDSDADSDSGISDEAFGSAVAAVLERQASKPKTKLAEAVDKATRSKPTASQALKKPATGNLNPQPAIEAARKKIEEQGGTLEWSNRKWVFTNKKGAVREMDSRDFAEFRKTLK